MAEVKTDSLDGNDAATESRPNQQVQESPIAKAIREMSENGLEFTGAREEPDVEDPDATDEGTEGTITDDDESGEVVSDEGEGAEAGAEGEDDGAEVGEGGEESEAEVEAEEGEESDVEEDDVGDVSKLEFVEVETPGRREGETSRVRVHPEDEQIVRMLKNNGLRREEYNRQLGSLREQQVEVEEFVTRVQTDPVGLFIDNANPQTKEALVREVLLNEPELREKVSEELLDFDTNPATFQKAQAEAKALRLERQQELYQRQSEIRAAEAQAARVIQAVNQLIPGNAPEEDADAFFRDSMQYLEYVANKHGADQVTEQAVPELLRDRLRRYGLDKAEDAAGDESEDGASDAKKGSRSKTATLEDAKEGQEKVAAKSKKRKKVVAAAPAGAGAKSSTGIKPPKGQTVSERLKWAREKGIFGAR